MENKDWAGISPNWDFYEKKEIDWDAVFWGQKLTEKQIDDLLGDNIYTRILNGVDKMKEDVWYKVESEEKKEIIKDMIDVGFLPDISFNDDFSKIKRSGTDIIFEK